MNTHRLWLSIMGLALPVAPVLAGDPPQQPMILYGEILGGEIKVNDTLRGTIGGRDIEAPVRQTTEGLYGYHLNIPAWSAKQPNVASGRPDDKIRFTSLGSAQLDKTLAWTGEVKRLDLDAGPGPRPPRPSIEANAVMMNAGVWGLSCQIKTDETDALTQTWQYRWLVVSPPKPGTKPPEPQVNPRASGELTRKAGQTNIACEAKTVAEQNLPAGFTALRLVVTPINTQGERGWSAVRDAKLTRNDGSL